MYTVLENNNYQVNLSCSLSIIFVVCSKCATECSLWHSSSISLLIGWPLTQILYSNLNKVPSIFPVNEILFKIPDNVILIRFGMFPRCMKFLHAISYTILKALFTLLDHWLQITKLITEVTFYKEQSFSNLNDKVK